MSDATLPHALVEKAARAAYEAREFGPAITWEELEEHDKALKDEFVHFARAALEAAAPSLRAETWRAASKIAANTTLTVNSITQPLKDAEWLCSIFDARAAEIEGGKG